MHRGIEAAHVCPNARGGGRALRQQDLLVARLGRAPPPPRPETEEQVAKAEQGRARAEEVKEPPGVADDTTESAPRILLEERPGVRGRVVSFG